MAEQIIEQGFVLKSENGIAEIALSNSAACSSCDSLFCSANSEGKNILIADNTVNAKAGDFVKVMISGGVLVQATLMLYVIPLAILVATIMLFYSVWHYSELFSFTLGIAVTGLYYALIFLLGHTKSNKTPMPKVIGIKSFTGEAIEF